MPPLLTNPDYNVISPEVMQTDFGYDYPEGLNLRPGSSLHSKIIREVMDRARLSYASIQKRHSSWRKVDETLTAYASTSAVEDAVKSKDSRKPVSIVIPMSYAVMDTLITYMVTSFLNEEILFKFNPVGPEDTSRALLLEKNIALQCWRSKVGLALHTMWRDSIAYGIGVTSPAWYVTKGKKRVSTPKGFNGLNGFVQTGVEETVEDYVKFEGNRLDNIDPYCYLPDPSVAAHEVQKGEFVGWLARDSFVGLLRKEASQQGYFNVKYLRGCSGQSSLFYGDQSARDMYKVRSASNTSNSTKPVDAIYMYIDLIPKDWGLGDKEYPEKWVFGVASDSIVIMCGPAGLDHDMYPVAVSAPDNDGYSVAPISRLEILSGMQTTVDWLINAHITNIRKAINDMLIVDPSMINMNDLENPTPGKLIRLRRPAWGKGIESAVKQLSVSDVTRQHIADASVITDLMQKCGAAPDSMQGIMRTGGERRSATESRDTRTSAFSRVDKMVILSNLQAMTDIGQMMASNTQQFMTEDVWMQINGDWPASLGQEFAVQGGMVKVSPADLNILYDCRISDGSPSGGEFVESWIQMFQIAASQPQVWQSLDGVRLFTHIARMMGAKNIYDFVNKGGAVQAQVLPDEQVAQMAQQGNVVPLSGAGMGSPNMGGMMGAV